MLCRKYSMTSWSIDQYICTHMGLTMYLSCGAKDVRPSPAAGQGQLASEHSHEHESKFMRERTEPIVGNDLSRAALPRERLWP